MLTDRIDSIEQKREKRKAYMREYYAKNKGKFRPRDGEKRSEYNENRRKKYAEDEVHRQRCRDDSRKWQESNPRARANQRMRKYGITIERYESMLDEQGGVCAICRGSDNGDKSTGRFHVDHCHKTGKVRGLLCMSCNHGLGKFKDSIESLRSAAAYLESQQRADTD